MCWSNVVVPRDLSPFESAYAACGSPFGVVAAQAFSVNFGLKVAIPSGGWFSLGGSPLLLGVHTYAAPTLSQVYSSGVWTDQFIQTFTDNQQYIRTPSTPWTPYHQ